MVPPGPGCRGPRSATLDTSGAQSAKTRVRRRPFVAQAGRARFGAPAARAWRRGVPVRSFSRCSGPCVGSCPSWPEREGSCRSARCAAGSDGATVSETYDLFQQGRSHLRSGTDRAGDRRAREGEAPRAERRARSARRSASRTSGSAAGRRRRPSSGRSSSSRPRTSSRTTRLARVAREPGEAATRPSRTSSSRARCGRAPIQRTSSSRRRPRRASAGRRRRA